MTKLFYNISFFLNIFFLCTVTCLSFFLYELNGKLTTVIKNFEEFVNSTGKGLALLNQEVLILKHRNLELQKEVALKEIFIKEMSIEDVSVIYMPLIAKIILFIILLLLISYFVYFFSVGSFSVFNVFLSKLFTLTTTVKMQLFGLFGIEQIKTISFFDIAGNNFVVSLANHDSSINIDVKVIGSSEYLSITDFITIVRSDITILNEVVKGLSSTLIALRPQFSLDSNAVLLQHPEILKLLSSEATASLLEAITPFI